MLSTGFKYYLNIKEKKKTSNRKLSPIIFCQLQKYHRLLDITNHSHTCFNKELTLIIIKGYFSINGHSLRICKCVYDCIWYYL